MVKSFDVFLSHNSKDKPVVRKLAEVLRARGLKVWLDEWELVPGRPWQEALEEVIETTRSTAVLVGKDGLGPWQDAEMRGCLSEFAGRNLSVIPVLLPGAPEVPKLPFFLKRFTWVDLREGLTEEGIARLHWGITGKRPPDRSKPEPAYAWAPAQPTSYEVSSGVTPQVFISYTRDNKKHNAWVHELATRLSRDGIKTNLDQRYLPGEQPPSSLEAAVRDSSDVLIVCTPGYKGRSEDLKEGLIDESSVVTEEVLLSQSQLNLIPILRGESWQSSAPLWLQSRPYLDFRNNGNFERNYGLLLSRLIALSRRFFEDY